MVGEEGERKSALQRQHLLVTMVTSVVTRMFCVELSSLGTVWVVCVHLSRNGRR